MIVAALLIRLVLLPYRLWCLARHRRYWRLAPLGWSWACELDDFE